jgi:hypothetical protein
MNARIEKSGGLITGIRIETSDARRYFPSGSKSVELELGHLRIQCELQARFWFDRPEISDARLCRWLEEQLFELNLPGASVPLEMVRSGNVYRLRLHPTRQQARRLGFGLSV